MTERLVRDSGFSLVELVIVVVIIGVIAAIAVPRISRASDGANEAALRATVRNVASKIEVLYGEEGKYPDDIDPAWFSPGRLSNPYDPDHPTPVFVSSKAKQLHPKWKVIRSGSTFWYNSANGAFRARVDDQLSKSETIDLYNLINGTNITSITQRK